MKRGFLALFFVLGLAAAGTTAGVASAGTAAKQVEPISPAAVRSAAATVARHSARVKAKRVVALPRGVRIAGVRVGLRAPERAERVVEKAFAARLTVVVDRLRLKVDPRKFAKAYVTGAVRQARDAEAGTRIPLVVSVKGAAVRAWAARLAKRIDRRPGKTAVRLEDGRPWISPRAFGRHLDQGELVQRVVRALASNTRRPVNVKTRTLRPLPLAEGSRAVIVIDRAKNELHLYKDAEPWRTFKVATGQAAYPTPQGRFEIVVKWTNPWWYPPASPWAAGQSPVPPGPGNPLGTRWMGLSAPGVGIHGTPRPESLGYSLSHGCIRMLIPQAEWLFEHVGIGTPVFIV
ncbi:MAG TPA: L,D-transpeptidase family protein [Gaiellaceae bacterium]